MSLYSLQWASSRFKPRCLDRFIKAVNLGDLARVQGSSQSAFLICRPCSLLLRHPVNMGCFLFYFIQRGFVIQYPCPWAGTVSFILFFFYCESLVSIRCSEQENVPGPAEWKRKKREASDM